MKPFFTLAAALMWTQRNATGPVTIIVYGALAFDACYEIYQDRIQRKLDRRPYVQALRYRPGKSTQQNGI